MTRRVPLTLTLYFYPRPPRGGRPILRSAVLAAKGISIHALREEGDSSPFFKGKIAVLISIHALREEGDLSTWGAAQCEGISIHALREEGDGEPRT